ncbi:MAG TPA: nucleotide exchange factor GrpE [Burkholderiales bacterium]|nr:nucleotide exchange factor GrpE [Burkholderiales bacterium]
MKPEQPDLTSPRGEPRAANEPVAQPETMPSLEELLREAELKAAEHHDAWLRAKAEAENIRKRTSDEVAKAHRYGIEKFAADLLAVKDSLEAALAAETATPESLRSGVELTLRQLESVLERQSIRSIDPAGQKFDPHQHQAISMLPSDKEPNTVINVLQKGYLLHDRVLRPALVTVAKPRDA